MLVSMLAESLLLRISMCIHECVCVRVFNLKLCNHIVLGNLFASYIVFLRLFLTLDSHRKPI